MYKNFMLKCQIFNLYTFKWENQTFFFETEEEMIDFIKNGDKKLETRCYKGRMCI